jgi:hypothetical protein
MRAALPRARGFQPGLRPDRATGQGRRYCTASHAAAPLPSARLPPLFLKPACACGRRGVHGGQGLHQAAAGAARHRVLRQGGAVQASAAADVAVRPRAAAGGAHLSTASTPAANPQATTPPLPASTKCIPTHAIANRSNAFSPRPASLAGQDEARQAADLCQSGCARARPPPTRLRPARQPRQLAGHLPPGGAALPAQDGGLAGERGARCAAGKAASSSIRDDVLFWQLAEEASLPLRGAPAVPVSSAVAQRVLLQRPRCSPPPPPPVSTPRRKPARFYILPSSALTNFQPNTNFPQEPRLRRVHVRTAMDIKMDPERPEYHRAIAHWARPGGGPGLHGWRAGARRGREGAQGAAAAVFRIGWTANSSTYCSCARLASPPPHTHCTTHPPRTHTHTRARKFCPFNCSWDGSRGLLRRAGGGEHGRTDQQPRAVAALCQRAAGDSAGTAAGCWLLALQLGAGTAAACAAADTPRWCRCATPASTCGSPHLLCSCCRCSALARLAISATVPPCCFLPLPCCRRPACCQLARSCLPW